MTVINTNAIDVVISEAAYNPCAVVFVPGKHWLARFSRGLTTLDWYLDGPIKPTADHAVATLESAIAVWARCPTVQELAAVLKLPLQTTRDMWDAAYHHRRLGLAAERWREIAGPAVLVTPAAPLKLPKAKSEAPAAKPLVVFGSRPAAPAPPPPPPPPQAPKPAPKPASPLAGW